MDFTEQLREGLHTFDAHMGWLPWLDVPIETQDGYAWTDRFLFQEWTPDYVPVASKPINHTIEAVNPEKNNVHPLAYTLILPATPPTPLVNDVPNQPTNCCTIH